MFPRWGGLCVSAYVSAADSCQTTLCYFGWKIGRGRRLGGGRAGARRRHFVCVKHKAGAARGGENQETEEKGQLEAEGHLIDSFQCRWPCT